MAETGTIALYLALVLSVYGAFGSVLGRLRSSPQLLDSARYAVYMVPMILAVATFSLVMSFLRHDFRVEYVAAHSNLAMNPEYTWVAIYAGNAGSLLYIAFTLSLMVAIMVALAPKALTHSLPYTIAILMVIVTFFIGVMVALANPFDTLSFTPPDGQGINPLLTHPGMFIHPPLLMTGLAAVSIPFAIAVGSLISGRSLDGWVDVGRVWALVVWAMLGTGVLLGAWWAYTILGWGGYWAWDPIENVALMPWLALTASVHSLMVQKRRGMFRMWNIVLVNIAFTLSLFGIFINRGGPVPSVHSFGASTLGWVFLGFLGVSVLFSFGVFAFRYNSMRSAASLDSMLSREAAFLLNNLLLLSVAFVTLWGVVFPLISQMFRGVTVTVAAPFYNQVNGPLLLALIFLMGVGPLLPWRHATATTLRRAIQTPGIVAIVTVGLLLVVGVSKPFALVAFGLCAFVVAGIVREWVHGTLVRHRRGENYLAAFGGLIAANRPRYGGYVAHLAIVVLALGVAGSSFYGTQRDIIMAPGDEETVGKYTVRFEGVRTETRADRIEFFNDLTVSQDGGEVMGMTAWRAFYPDLRMAATRAAIRSTPVEDLYIVSSESLEDGRVAFRILVNPLVWWMWLAGPLLLLGTLVALWPQRSLAGSPVSTGRAGGNIAAAPFGPD